MFHFKTFRRKDDGEEVVIDDSRKLGKPFELLIGKEFKMPVLEEFIKTMREGEVSHFTAIKPLVYNYPVVSQAYRKYVEEEKSGKSKEVRRSHCCGMNAKKQFDFEDLNELFQHPTDLEFVIELLKIEHPESHEKEVWQMDQEEKLSGIPRLREEGNQLYKQGLYQEASMKYGKALTMLEQLIIQEKPGDEEWKVLDDMKIPLLSNYSQCQLLMKEYYKVIEHCSEVIKRDPNNVKSYFRRGKAHAAVWNVTEARQDFETTKNLDPSLGSLVTKELQTLETMVKAKDSEIKEKLEGKLF